MKEKQITLNRMNDQKLRMGSNMENKPILYLAQAYSKYPQVEGMQLYYKHPAYILAQATQKRLWDLGFEAFSPILYSHPFHVAEFCPRIDYVAHDLHLLESWCIELNPCVDCNAIHTQYCLHQCQDKQPREYQPNVVCVFADDCLTFVEDKPKEDSCWCVDPLKSHGARAEYEFAHAHHILCVPLKCVLEKGKVDPEDAF